MVRATSQVYGRKRMSPLLFVETKLIIATTEPAVNTTAATTVATTPAPILDCSCVEILEPVCGKNWRTYPNKCLAKCYGAEVATNGPCKDKFDLLRSSTSDALCFAKKNDKHAGSIWHGNAETQDDCKSKCVSNEECNFYSFWHTGWCQIDRVCSYWGSDGSKMISSYKRRRRTKLCLLCRKLSWCYCRCVLLTSLAWSRACNLANLCETKQSLPQRQAVYGHGLLSAWSVASFGKIPTLKSRHTVGTCPWGNRMILRKATSKALPLGATLRLRSISLACPTTARRAWFGRTKTR